MGKCKRKRGGSTYNGSGRGILRSVTGAHELIVRGGPGYNTSQMGAHGVKSVTLEGLVLLYDEVSGISLKSLGKRTISGQLGLEVWGGKEIISKGVLGGNSSSATSGRRGEEEVNVRKSKSGNGDSSRTNKDKVHDITTLLVNVKLISGSVERGGYTVGSHRGGGESEYIGGGEKSGGEGKELHLEWFYLTWRSEMIIACSYDTLFIQRKRWFHSVASSLATHTSPIVYHRKTQETEQTGFSVMCRCLPAR